MVYYMQECWAGLTGCVTQQRYSEGLLDQRTLRVLPSDCQGVSYATLSTNTDGLVLNYKRLIKC